MVIVDPITAKRVVWQALEGLGPNTSASSLVEVAHEGCGEESMNGTIAANIAREATRGMSSTYFHALSAEMCWDAVALCQGRSPGRYIETTDQLIANLADLQNIPEGATIGFFDGGTLVHAMISLGGGNAAGNKNACIGMGNPVGWESLDLNQGWNQRDFGVRHLTVRFRVFV